MCEALGGRQVFDAVSLWNREFTLKEGPVKQTQHQYRCHPNDQKRNPATPWPFQSKAPFNDRRNSIEIH